MLHEGEALERRLPSSWFAFLALAACSIFVWLGRSAPAVARGEVYVWGQRFDSTPALVDSLTDVVAIAAGENENLAVTSDGTVWVWSHVAGDTPAPVDGVSNVVAVAAGISHRLALTSDGTLWAWGDNNYGQLGDGTTLSRETPAPVLNMTNVIAMT